MGSNNSLIKEAEAIRAELEHLGWYEGVDIDRVGIDGVARITSMLNRLSELGELIQPRCKTSREVKVQCLLEGASQGGGDESVIPTLIALGVDALNPLMNIIVNYGEDAFRRRASIEALTRLDTGIVNRVDAAFPLVYILRNPWSEDFKVLVLAMRGLAAMDPQTARQVLREFPEDLYEADSYEAQTLQRERQSILSRLQAA